MLQTVLHVFAAIVTQTNMASAKQSDQLLEMIEFDGRQWACKTSVFPRHSTVSMVLLVYICVPIAMVGVMANITGLCIWTRMHSHLNMHHRILATVCLTDSVVLITFVGLYTLPRLGDMTGLYSITAIAFTLTPGLFGIYRVARFSSAYLVVLIAIHRCVAIFSPTKARRVFTSWRCSWLSVLVVTVCFAINLPAFWSYRVANHCYYYNLHYQLPELQRAPEAAQIKAIEYSVPIVLLIVVDSIVLWAIAQVPRWRPVTTGDPNDVKNKKEQTADLKLSALLFSLVIVCVLSLTYSLVVHVLTVTKTHNTSWLFQVFVELDRVLIVVKSSCHVMFYWLYSRPYRQSYLRMCSWPGGTASTKQPTPPQHHQLNHVQILPSPTGNGTRPDRLVRHMSVIYENNETDSLVRNTRSPVTIVIDTDDAFV